MTRQDVLKRTKYHGVCIELSFILVYISLILYQRRSVQYDIKVRPLYFWMVALQLVYCIIICVFIPVTRPLVSTKLINVTIDVFLVFMVIAAPFQYELLGLAFYRTDDFIVLRIIGIFIAFAETVASLLLVARINITRVDPLQVFSPVSAKTLHSHTVSMYATVFAVALKIWPVGVTGLYMVLIPFHPLFQRQKSNMSHICTLEFAFGIVFVQSFGVDILDFTWHWIVPVVAVCLAFLLRTHIDYGKQQALTN